MLKKIQNIFYRIRYKNRIKMVIPTENKVGTGEYTESTYLIEDISIHKYLNYIYIVTQNT